MSVKIPVPAIDVLKKLEDEEDQKKTNWVCICSHSVWIYSQRDKTEKKKTPLCLASWVLKSEREREIDQW